MTRTSLALIRSLTRSSRAIASRPWIRELKSYSISFRNIISGRAARQSQELTALVESRPAGAHLGEALAAVYRAIASGLERDLGGLTTVGTDSIEELSLLSRAAVAHAAATAPTFALVTAISATGATTLRLAKAAGGEKLLVVCRKSKLLPAVHASKSLVGEGHSKASLLKSQSAFEHLSGVASAHKFALASIAAPDEVSIEQAISNKRQATREN